MGAAGGNRKSVLPSRRGGTASDCKTQPRMRCYLPTGVVSRKGQAYDGKQRAALCSAHPCFFRRVGTTRSLLSAPGANARPVVRAGIRSGNLCRWGSPLHRRELKHRLKGRRPREAVPGSVAGPTPGSRAVGGRVDEDWDRENASNVANTTAPVPHSTVPGPAHASGSGNRRSPATC